MDLAQAAFAYFHGTGVELVWRDELVLRHAPVSHPFFGQVLRGLVDALLERGQQLETERRRFREHYERFESDRGGDRFVALVDGEIVGSGAAKYFESGVYLLGGNVAEEARGRGVYRALVRARWDEAVRRGTPALVVQAGRLSKPILERLGFRPVCEVHALLEST